MCAVYVDDMFRHPMGQFRGMKMSHMIADTEEELHAMASRLKLKRAWYQGDHYDVSKGMREMAIAYGAKEVSMRELGAICFCKRAGWPYNSPHDALQKMIGNGIRGKGKSSLIKERRDDLLRRVGKTDTTSNSGGSGSLV